MPLALRDGYGGDEVAKVAEGWYGLQCARKICQEDDGCLLSSQGCRRGTRNGAIFCRMTPEPVVILTFEVVKGRISLCSQVFPPGARGVGVDADAPRFLFYAVSPHDCAECGLCGLRQEPSAPKQVAHVPCSAASRLSDCAATGLWVSAEEGRSGDKVGAGVAVVDGVVLDMDGY